MNTKNTGDYIALVDKREDISGMYEGWLEEEGYEVKTFTGVGAGNDFFEYLRSNHAPEVVILDRITSRNADADLPEYLHRLAPETDVIGLFNIEKDSEEFIENVEDDLQLPNYRNDLLDTADEFYDGLK